MNHDNGCCGHFVGSEDPLGHGSMTYSDNMGRAYHGVSVSDYDTHSGSNPTDVKTLSEWTTRFDNLGRSVARTQWLVAQSTIDAAAVRIAGLDSVSASDGLTTLTFYDNNIGDGVGLDSTGGMTLPKLGGGTYSLSLESLFDILADTEANGGANTTFDPGVSAGSAVVSIAPTEEISVSISDAAGRNVMSAQLQAHNGTTPLAIINWSSQVYDQEVNISGFGDVIETRSVNRAGKVTKSRSDASGRMLESYDQLDKKSWSEYDSAGNITKSRDPNGVGFDATYDELGRMLTQTDTFGDMTESVYDKEGNVIEQIDAKGNSTFMVYDAQNRRRTVTDRISGVTTYALNAGGQLTALTDAEGQTTSYTYNARGEKTEEQYPDHTSGSPGDSTYGKILFTYDPAGRLSRRDDQNGDTVTNVYDMAGRLLQKDYRTRANSPSGTIADSDTFTYDRSSRMLTAVSGRYSNTVTNTYDVAGRLKDESLTIATKTYTVSRTYDSLGRLFQMTYPNSTVIERTYTDRNQLYTVKYGSNIEDTRTYDDGGRLSTSAYRNGVTTTYNYRDVSGDKDNLLASIQFAHPGGTATNRQVGDLTYTWDANKNKTKETIAGTLSGYSFDTTLGTDPDGYDDEDRITYFKRSNTTNPQTWTLTSVGDWSSWNNFSTTAETRTHGAAHELTRIGSGTTPATILYDVKGNITQNQRTPGTSSTYQNYVWDFDNRMISADTNGDNTADVTFEYDALGRRVARTQGATAVVYIHAGQQVVCDYTRGANANTTPVFRYVWGDYIDEPILRQTGSSTLLYYHHNQQFSTVALTSASGLVVTRYGYTAYGDQTILSHTGASQTYATYSNRISYTGREWDDSLKAHYFRARWYDAALGRFVNRDPIGFESGCANFYEWCFASPLHFVDPSGLQRIPPQSTDEFQKGIKKGIEKGYSSGTGGSQSPAKPDRVSCCPQDSGKIEMFIVHSPCIRGYKSHWSFIDGYFWAAIPGKQYRKSKFRCECEASGGKISECYWLEVGDEIYVTPCVLPTELGTVDLNELAGVLEWNRQFGDACCNKWEIKEPAKPKRTDTIWYPPDFPEKPVEIPVKKPGPVVRPDK